MDGPLWDQCRDLHFEWHSELIELNQDIELVLDVLISLRSQ